VFSIITLFNEGLDDARAQNEIGFLAILLALTLAVAALLYQRRLSTVTLALLALLTGASVAGQIIGMTGLSLALALLALLSAAILARPNGFLAINAIVFVALLYGALATTAQPDTPLSAERINRLTIIGALAIVSLTTRVLVIWGERWMLAERIASALFESSLSATELAIHGATAAEALDHAAERIGEHFNASHVGIYLVDSAKNEARMVAGTGKAGRQLVSQEHTVAPGTIGAVGQVLLHGEPVAGEPDRRLRTGLDVYFKDSQAQMTAPIRDGDAILGVIDVHSTTPEAFREDDLRVLVQFTRALEAVTRIIRQAEEQAQIMTENQRLRLEAEINRREIERLSHELTRSGWQDFLNGRRGVTGLTLEHNRLSNQTDWSQALIEASQNRQPVRLVQGDRETVAVPVILRGQVIGAIEVEPEPGQAEAETVEMVQAVAQRLALSLDNARLLEEAQETTAQEQRISELVARFQSAESVDDLLQMALSELSQSLGAEHAAIRLG